MITLIAPAKINLTLEVLAKRPDGYHEIRSVMQTVSLADTISLEPAEKFELHADSALWDGEKSLVSKACLLLQRSAGRPLGARVSVKKRIPLLSGLGGDSSDAAATLVGLNRLWGLGLSRKELVSLGTELGSDVAFFFSCGTALAEGRGEKVTPLPDARTFKMVLVVPPVARMPGKTKALYQALTPRQFTDGRNTERLVGILGRGGEIDSSLLFNCFEEIAAALQPEILEVRRRLQQAGFGHVHLAGSGPTHFVLVKDEMQAQSLIRDLTKEGIETYAAKTVARTCLPSQSPSG